MSGGISDGSLTTIILNILEDGPKTGPNGVLLFSIFKFNSSSVLKRLII